MRTCREKSSLLSELQTSTSWLTGSVMLVDSVRAEPAVQQPITSSTAAMTHAAATTTAAISFSVLEKTCGNTTHGRCRN